jgi:hypothetical protein
MCVVLVVLIFWLTITPGRAAESRPPAKATEKESKSNSQVVTVTLRGRVVCLPEEMHRLHGIELPSGHGHVWAIRTAAGEFYTILPGRYSEAIFQDERVRAKELQLRVRILPKSQAIEVLTVYSVRNGVIQDLYYYCDVCAIKSVSPAICACCQGPVELVETPLSKRED